MSAPAPGAWLATIRRYLLVIAPAHLLWEVVQLPLYTIWREKPLADNVFAVVHCTAGDVLIAGFSLLGALLLLGHTDWPGRRYGVVAVGTVVAGVAYTIFSEWLNTEIRGSWAYAETMPLVPVLGTGITPLLQWIVIPSGVFYWLAKRPAAA